MASNCRVLIWYVVCKYIYILYVYIQIYIYIYICYYRLAMVYTSFLPLIPFTNDYFVLNVDSLILAHLKII